MMCHEAISVFLDQIYFMFLRKKDPYIYGRSWFFSTKFHWNFFIAFRSKFIFVGLNEIHHSFRSIIFFVWNSRKNAVMNITETVFVHNYLWSLFHSCFSYFPFFMFLFSLVSLARKMYVLPKRFICNRLECSTWNIFYTMGDVNKRNKNVTIFIFQWKNFTIAS